MKHVGSIAVFLFVFQSIGYLHAQDVKGDTERLGFYKQCVGQFVTSCEAQAALMHTDSLKIRCDAALACLKANFYKTHKEVLLAEMDRLQLEPKRRTVDFFLVKSFNDFLAQDVGELLADHIRARGRGTELP
jgi:hypothetical protein